MPEKVRKNPLAIANILFPALSKTVTACPLVNRPVAFKSIASTEGLCSKGVMTLGQLIIHLNDMHELTREEIADELDKLYADIPQVCTIKAAMKAVK